MIILDKQATRVIARILSAARDNLKGGDHDGRCVYRDPFDRFGSDESDNTICTIHAQTYERRQQRLREAIAEWDALND